MPHFTVYKIVMPDGTVEYRAFSEEFLKGPVPQSCDFSLVFLEPLKARKYYTFIEAESDGEAIRKAQAEPSDWKWSVHNWLLPEWYDDLVCSKRGGDDKTA